VAIYTLFRNKSFEFNLHGNNFAENNFIISPK